VMRNRGVQGHLRTRGGKEEEKVLAGQGNCHKGETRKVKLRN